MRKALVYYSYSANNAGDMAICLGAIALLKKCGYSTTMVSRYHESAPQFLESKSFIEGYYPDVAVYPGVFALDRSAGKASRLLQHAAGLAKCVFAPSDQRMKALIDEADVVFFNGGNLLRCNSWIDFARLTALFYPIKMASRMGKPLICLPQSTAVIGKKWQNALGSLLSMFDLVFVRESASLDKLTNLYPDVRFRGSTDLAFFMDDLLGEEIRKEGAVALVVRGTGIGDIGELPAARKSELVAAFERFALQNPHYKYVIIAQTDKDRELSNYLLERLSGQVKVEILEEHDAFKLLSVYKRVSMTMTMRLHAGILSMRANTPVVGLFDESWGLKNIGITSDFGMGCCIDSSCLQSEFDRVMSQYNPDEIAFMVDAFRADIENEITR